MDAKSSSFFLLLKVYIPQKMSGLANNSIASTNIFLLVPLYCYIWGSQKNAIKHLFHFFKTNTSMFAANVADWLVELKWQRPLCLYLL